MRNSSKCKLNCEKSTKDMKDIGEPPVLRRQVRLQVVTGFLVPLRVRVLNVFVDFSQFEIDYKAFRNHPYQHCRKVRRIRWKT